MLPGYIIQQHTIIWSSHKLRPPYSHAIKNREAAHKRYLRFPSSNSQELLCICQELSKFYTETKKKIKTLLTNFFIDFLHLAKSIYHSLTFSFLNLWFVLVAALQSYLSINWIFRSDFYQKLYSDDFGHILLNHPTLTLLCLLLKFWWCFLCPVCLKHLEGLWIRWSFLLLFLWELFTPICYITIISASKPSSFFLQSRNWMLKFSVSSVLPHSVIFHVLMLSTYI